MNLLGKPWGTSLSRSLLLVTLLSAAYGVSWSGQGATTSCVTDDLARKVCVQGIPRRIVSFAPSLTEIVFALSAGDRLVGRTQRCNLPLQALKVPEIGGYLNPDFERVLSSRPDLVLTNRTSVRKQTVTRLDTMGIPVFVADTGTIDDIASLLTRLGTLLGRESEAVCLVDDLQKRRNAIRKSIPKSDQPTVLFAVGTHPLVVAGGKSFLGSLIRDAGGVNIAEDVSKPFVRYSIEEVIKKDPEIILVLDKECSGERCVDQWRHHKVLSAVRNKRVYSMNADLMARPSPRILEGLALLVKYMHDETTQNCVTGPDDAR
jgi:iron complex transport system substrate-binding protein